MKRPKPCAHYHGSARMQTRPNGVLDTTRWEASVLRFLQLLNDKIVAFVCKLIATRQSLEFNEFLSSL